MVDGPIKSPSDEAYYEIDQEASVPFGTNCRHRWKRRDQNRSKKEKMSWIWLEAALPLGIIAGMLCVMGNAQYYIHKAAHGRPKHIGNDMWDVAMERRDKKLMEQASSASPN